MTLTAYQADTLVTLAGSAPGYGLVRQGAVVVEGGEIAWVGAAADLPAGYGAARRVHFGDRVITPGLIDCHTHIVFVRRSDAGVRDAAQRRRLRSDRARLPGAFYTLGATRPPPVEYFRRHGVAMAVATDCNPGSSPLTSILLAMNMGCTLFGLTPREALTGATRHAARALGLSDRGEIAAGKRADLAVWDIGHPSELSYRIGFNPLHRRIFGGAM